MLDNDLCGIEPMAETGRLGFRRAQLPQVLTDVGSRFSSLQGLGDAVQLPRFKARAGLAGQALASMIVIIARQANSGNPVGRAVKACRRCHRHGQRKQQAGSGYRSRTEPVTKL